MLARIEKVAPSFIRQPGRNLSAKYLRETHEVKLDIIRSIRTDMTSPKITENETKVGDALITILDRWEDVFESIQGGNKYNKNSIR